MLLMWLIGVSIIWFDLKYYLGVVTGVEDPRTDEEHAADLRVSRGAELQWPWRSTYKFVSHTHHSHRHPHLPRCHQFMDWRTFMSRVSLRRGYKPGYA